MVAVAAGASIDARQLEPMSRQVSVFTPERDASGWARFGDQLPRWAHLFDAESAALTGADRPALVSLRSAAGAWRFDLERDRADLYWMRAVPTTPALSWSEFHAEAIPLLQAYVACIDARVGRLASVINRFARPASPAAVLTAHFCRDRWNQQWFGDATSFDLHGHKRTRLGRFDINYRMRARAGTAFGTGTPPLLNVEQDANTRDDMTPYARFDADAIAEFFRLTAAEHERVAASLFPEGDPP